MVPSDAMSRMGIREREEGGKSVGGHSRKEGRSPHLVFKGGSAGRGREQC